ncbi:MAG TPA: prepilin-type N-terminal cleavage/methylation domain-containing protein [Usitatibacter sp.]|jgi:prepilin-type N-terminal cleavage/methylation domain-containing protein|nr:prepilin-type N-terminal cleavage/methylation domain-containing protein [Usitatibacter sp.]
MRRQQSGFTLVEIAIVLVIIGLLLGGILKGQELINSAKVKNLANDFRVIPTYIYAYQDKFKALPGDDANVAAHITGATAAAAAGIGNGVVNGNWNSTTNTDESFLFWQHVRLANLAAGPTDVADTTYVPRNAVGGILGISSGTTAQMQISGMTGTYQVCSAGILGKFAKQLDIQMDDGHTDTGSMRVVADGAALGSPAIAAPDDATNYTVCTTF